MNQIHHLNIALQNLKRKFNNSYMKHNNNKMKKNRWFLNAVMMTKIYKIIIEMTSRKIKLFTRLLYHYI